MKQLGHIKSATIKIDEPFKFNFDKLETNAINLLVGTNGVGKSVYLKINWMVATYMNYMLIAADNNVPFNGTEMLHFLMTNTFTKCPMTGVIKMTFENGEFEAEFKDGSVVSVNTDTRPDIKGGAAPIYMSTTMRMFTDIVQYMRMKKLLGIPKGMPNEADLTKLLELYRMYDISYVEGLLHYLENNLTEKFLLDFNTHIKLFDDKFSVKDFQVNHELGDITYCDATGSDISLTSLGNGHQALINMVMAMATNF